MAVARWRGVQSFKSRLKRIPPLVREEARDALRRNAIELQTAIKTAAPRDSGDLAESIAWQWSDGTRIKYSQRGKSKSVPARGNVIAVRVSAGNARVRYAHLVEFGAAPHVAGGKFKGAQHPGAPAQPFFYPTYRARKRRVKNNMRRVLRAAVKRSKS